jgi:hypothetical protein
MSEEFNDWQPAKIAPLDEILKHHSVTRYAEFCGQLVHVRPYVGGLMLGSPYCGAERVFLVEPMDALRITNGEHPFLCLCEHQIQTD